MSVSHPTRWWKIKYLMKQPQSNRLPGDAKAAGLKNHTLSSTALEQWLSRGSFAQQGTFGSLWGHF